LSTFPRVRHAVATWYHDSLERRGQDPRAPLARARAQVRSLSRQVMFDTAVERRITRMEKRFGIVRSEELAGDKSPANARDPGMPPIS
jgi:hypothetical protein